MAQITSLEEFYTVTRTAGNSESRPKQQILGLGLRKLGITFNGSNLFNYETLSDTWASEFMLPSEEELVSAGTLALDDIDNEAYKRLRANEYPDIREYLDGIVKGDQAQIQAYIDACQAVKAKYPKGA